MKLGTCGLIINPYNGKVLTVSRKDDPTKFCMPGGKVDDDEDVVQGFVREIREELGWDLIADSSGIYVSFNGGEDFELKKFYESGDIDDFQTTCFLLEPYKNIYKEPIFPEEGTMYRWLTWNQMCDPNISPFWKFNQKCYDKLMKNDLKPN